MTKSAKEASDSSKVSGIGIRRSMAHTRGSLAAAPHSARKERRRGREDAVRSRAPRRGEFPNRPASSKPSAPPSAPSGASTWSSPNDSPEPRLIRRNAAHRGPGQRAEVRAGGRSRAVQASSAPLLCDPAALAPRRRSARGRIHGDALPRLPLTSGACASKLAQPVRALTPSPPCPRGEQGVHRPPPARVAPPPRVGRRGGIRRPSRRWREEAPHPVGAVPSEVAPQEEGYWTRRGGCGCQHTM